MTTKQKRFIWSWSSGRGACVCFSCYRVNQRWFESYFRRVWRWTYFTLIYRYFDVSNWISSLQINNFLEMHWFHDIQKRKQERSCLPRKKRKTGYVELNYLSNLRTFLLEGRKKRKKISAQKREGMLVCVSFYWRRILLSPRFGWGVSFFFSSFELTSLFFFSFFGRWSFAQSSIHQKKTNQ